MRQTTATSALLALLCLCALSSVVRATSYTAAVNGAWNVAATWGVASAPGASDDVTIDNGLAVSLTISATVRSVQLSGTAFLYLTGFTSLSVSNCLYVPGPFTITGTGPASNTVTVSDAAPGTCVGSPGQSRISSLLTLANIALVYNGPATDLFSATALVQLAPTTSVSLSLTSGTAAISSAPALWLSRATTLSLSTAASTNFVMNANHTHGIGTVLTLTGAGVVGGEVRMLTNPCTLTLTGTVATAGRSHTSPPLPAGPAPAPI
jgi:hypothetical protein